MKIVSRKSIFLLFTLLTTVSFHGALAASYMVPEPTVFSLLAQGKQLGVSEKCSLFVSDVQNITNEHVPTLIASEKTDIVRIATFNVHFWTDPFEKANYQSIMQVIKMLNADVIVLQEAEFFDNNQINADLLAMGYVANVFCPTHIDRNGPFGNLIASKYPFVLKPFQQVFTVDQDVFEKRNFINIQIALPNSELLSVWGTHLDVWDKTEVRRKQEIQELIALIDADTSKHKVMLADFNAVRASDYQYEVGGKTVWDIIVADDMARTGIPTPTDAIALIEQAGFIDSFAKCGIPGPKFTVWPGKVVDFIWVSKEWQLPLAGSYVYYCAASDHFPIILDITYSQSNEPPV